MATFKIRYVDPNTGYVVNRRIRFDDSIGITAKEWAEDFAYTKAAKGWHEVEEVMD